MAGKQESWRPGEVVALIRKMDGVRAYDQRDVRQMARDGIVARYAERPNDGSNRVHAYSMGEVRLLLEAVASKHERRTGRKVRIPAPFATARTSASKPRRPKAARKSTPNTVAAPKAASVAPSASDEV